MGWLTRSTPETLRCRQLGRDAEVTVSLPDHTRDGVTVSGLPHLDGLLAVEGIGTVPTIRIEDVGTDRDQERGA
jgi:hypothetical protein